MKIEIGKLLLAISMAIAVYAERTATAKTSAGKDDLILTEVQATSLLVAHLRNLETQRDRMGKPPTPSLVNDQYAKILLDKLGNKKYLDKWMNSTFTAIGIDMIAIRSRAIDDWLLEERPNERQIVNLGAGMCTRPYRLDLAPKTSFFEVEKDLSLLQVKRKTLAEHPTSVGKVIDVGADVTSDDLRSALLDAGFDKSKPTDWVAEGLLGYLPIDSHQRVYQTAFELSAPGSRFLAWLTDPWTLEWCKLVGISFPHIGMRAMEETKQSLEEAGWSRNITILNDDIWYPKYKRAMNLPGYMVLAEINKDYSQEL